MEILFLHVEFFDALKDFLLKQKDDHIVCKLNKAELKMNPLAMLIHVYQPTEKNIW